MILDQLTQNVTFAYLQNLDPTLPSLTLELWKLLPFMFFPAYAVCFGVIYAFFHNVAGKYSLAGFGALIGALVITFFVVSALV